MIDQPEWAYHLARSMQCHRMALIAADTDIAHLHENLAEQHAQRARSAFQFGSQDAENLVPA